MSHQCRTGCARSHPASRFVALRWLMQRALRPVAQAAAAALPLLWLTLREAACPLQCWRQRAHSLDAQLVCHLSGAHTPSSVWHWRRCWQTWWPAHMQLNVNSFVNKAFANMAPTKPAACVMHTCDIWGQQQTRRRHNVMGKTQSAP